MATKVDFITALERQATTVEGFKSGSVVVVIKLVLSFKVSFQPNPVLDLHLAYVSAIESLDNSFSSTAREKPRPRKRGEKPSGTVKLKELITRAVITSL